MVYHSPEDSDFASTTEANIPVEESTEITPDNSLDAGNDQEEGSKKKVNIFETFSKFWVSCIMICAIIDMNLSYILAFLGREQIAETLSIAVVTEIIGVMAIYLIRAFLDSHFEAKDAIEHKKLDVYSLMGNISSSSDTSADDEDDDDELSEEIDDCEDVTDNAEG